MRRIRSELNLAPSKQLEVWLQGGSEHDRARLERSETLLASLGKVARFTWVDEQADASQCAVALVGDLKLLIPLAGLVDVAAETARLRKQLQKEQQELAKSKGKLGNARFVENAPAEVVEQERERLASSEATVAELEAQLQRIASLAAE